MRPLHWAFAEVTRSLHMEQHEFPDVGLILNGDPAEYLKNVAGSHGQEGESRVLGHEATEQPTE